MSIHKTRQRGATLVEILVATFIAAIGVMGLSKYQMESLIATQQTQSSAMVTWQLYSMVEKMRANPVALQNGDYLKTGVDRSCLENACSNSQIAEHDIFVWSLENDQLFPAGQSDISQPGGAGNPHVLTIRWDGNRNGARGTGCDAANPEDMLCSSISLNMN